MKLRVHSIRLDAPHAAYDWEQKIGTSLEVDVELSYRRAPSSDKLARVVCVEDIVSGVHAVSARKTYRTIESLAEDVISSFWKKHGRTIATVTVRVRKIRPKSDRRIAGYEVEVSRP